MKLKKFQRKVGSVANYHPDPMPGRLPAEWTAEEGAEVMRVFRRAVKRNEPVDLNDLYEEMGDVLICLANLANEVNFDLGEIADKALEKLAEKVQEQQ